MAAHICDRCSKTLASRQSLWNHRQHCKDSKDELHTTLGNGLVIKSRSRTPSVHKEKIVSDIINNVGKMQEPKSDTGKEDIVGNFLNKVAQITNMRPMLEKTSSLSNQEAQKPKSLNDLVAELKSGKKTSSVNEMALKSKSLNDLVAELKSEKPTSSVNEMALKPKSLPDLPVEMKSDSEESTSSEDEITEEEDEVMPENPEELKEAFRNLYKKFRRDIEMYDKLVLMLDELRRMKCLTKEECNAMNEHLQNKIENRNL